jgi:hypothetical protein
VPPEEADAVKMLWEAPDDNWEEYILTHMHAIRAKYFPKKAAAEVGALSLNPLLSRCIDRACM